MSTEPPIAARIGNGIYRVDWEGRTEIVYVAGTSDDCWAFWNGRIFRSGPGDRLPPSTQPKRGTAPEGLTAPMPATVLKLLVEPGSKVKKGDTVLILEAMKMELPIRASRGGVVASINCREGQLVQPDAVLVELTPAVLS